jgi:predicted DNA-binding transcriptional regulator AlpA
MPINRYVWQEVIMELISTKELAKLLNISRAKLFKMRKSGTGPPYYQLENGTIRYDLNEVIKWLNELKKV